jgi:hypothetical protein
MTRRWRTTALVTVLLTLTMILLPTASMAASDAGADQSAVSVQQRALPECGPERDGEVREYFGALWQCKYINGHWKWIAIGCSGCFAPRETAFLQDGRQVARL